MFTKESENEPLLLSLRDAAGMLSLSERTVWSLARSGELPHVRVRRRLLFSVRSLHAWIEAHQRTGMQSGAG